MDILRILFGYYLNESEWRKLNDLSGSAYLGVPGGGTLEAVYQRAWWPSVLRLLSIGLPILSGGLYLLVSFVSDTTRIRTASAGLFIFLLFIAGILIVMGVLELVYIYHNWPGQTPQSAAVLSNGIAWMEENSVKFLAWKQMKEVRQHSVFMILLTQNGQHVRFHHMLFENEFGRRARIATGQLQSPEDLIVCPHCGEKITSDATRCLFCMKPVGEVTVGKAAANPCPVCGTAPQSPDDAFCRVCGTAIKTTVVRE